MIYALLFFLFFLGHGAYFSSLSPYILENYKDDSSLIILSSQIAAPLGQIASGYFTDKTKLLRAPLVFSLIAFGFFQVVFFSHLSTFGAIVCFGLLRFFVTASGQLLIVASLESGESHFARARALGTVGFFAIQMTLFMLLTRQTGLDATVLARYAAGFHVITALLALMVPVKRISEEHYYFRETLKFLSKPHMIIFFALSFIFNLCYQLVDFYLGRFLELAEGIRFVYLGWGLSVLLEIAFMPFTARIFASGRVRFLFLVSVIAGALRFGLLFLWIRTGLPIAPHYSQILHGIHFTGHYMGAIYLLKKSFPSHLYGTGLGFYQVICTSVGAMAGNFLTAISLGNAGVQDFSTPFAVAAVLNVLLFFAYFYLPFHFKEKEKVDDVEAVREV